MVFWYFYGNCAVLKLRWAASGRHDKYPAGRFLHREGTSFVPAVACPLGTGPEGGPQPKLQPLPTNCCWIAAAFWAHLTLICPELRELVAAALPNVYN